MPAVNHVYSAFSFITLILVLIPLPWHLEAWNTGTVLYMLWTATSLLIHFINSIIWDGNVVNHSPTWCDISTKLIIGAAIGIPCASLCINRRLYCISGVQTVTTSRKDKLKALAVDLSIGILIPMIIMALHYVVQGHRYDILEDVGCIPATYNVTLTYVLIQVPTLSIFLATTVYAVLTMRAFAHRQAQFKEFLNSGNSNISSSRYVRLIALASLEVIIGLPLALTGCILNATVYGPVNPWISWEDTHFEFWRVWMVPAKFWRADPLTVSVTELSRWSAVLCGLVFFAFFGFAEEARTNYKRAFANLCNLVGLKYPLDNPRFGGSGMFGSKASTLQGSGSSFSKFKISTPGTGGNSSHSALPIYVQKEVVNKRDSLDSFSDFMSVRSGAEYPTLAQPYTLPAGLSGPIETHSNTSTVIGAPSRSNSPTKSPEITGRPRIEISSAIYDDDVVVDPPTTLRTPESAFPRAVTPEVPPSFLDMETPKPQSALTKALRSPEQLRVDNRI